MDHAVFWSHIDNARTAKGQTAAVLQRTLAKLPVVEILHFDAWFAAYYDATRRNDLWAAVHAIRGGCGDDGFDYFRGWLISRGHAAVIAAIGDPEALADLIGETDPRYEAMLGVAVKAYRQATGTDMPTHDIRPVIPDLPDWPPDRVAPDAKWTADFFAATFPGLHARYVANVPPAPSGEISVGQFWSIIDAARSATAAATTQRLATAIHGLTTPDLLGFAGWLTAYNRALMREDVRAVARILLGKDDSETVAGFRGWLIAQGEAVVRTATHDPDAILELSTFAPASCYPVIFMATEALQARGIHEAHVADDDLLPIPDRETWSADWTIHLPTIDELRERFPRLTADLPDERLPNYDRQRGAARRAAATPPPAAAKRVRHAKFGVGTVVSTDTSASESKLVIDFPDGRKTIASRFVEPIE